MTVAYPPSLEYALYLFVALLYFNNFRRSLNLFVYCCYKIVFTWFDDKYLFPRSHNVFLVFIAYKIKNIHKSVCTYSLTVPGGVVVRVFASGPGCHGFNPGRVLAVT